jgi:chromosomal replication initiation ATPase DnaA
MITAEAFSSASKGIYIRNADIPAESVRLAKAEAQRFRSLYATEKQGNERKARRIAKLQNMVDLLKEQLIEARASIKAMQGLSRLSAQGVRDLEGIIAEVMARHEGVTWMDVISSRRGGADVVRCRHECMHAVKTQTRMSYPEIAKVFNRADHTSVMHAVKKIEAEKKGMRA